jgi:alanine racemase
MSPVRPAPSVVTTRGDHIVANLRAIREHVDGRKLLVAVKANAYGHGAVEVARLLARTGAADWLGVATVGEGIALREAGITLPILKLSMARGDEVADAVAADLSLVVVDTESIEAASAAAIAQGRTIAVHLKVDTGMRRIGCPPEYAVELARRAAAAPGLTLVGVMSHLPISDVPAGEEFTRGQIALFSKVAADVEDAVGPLIKHLAASGAVLTYPDAWFDLVRPGIIAYGDYPDPQSPRSVPLLPTLEWRSTLTFVKRVAAGETVSYGRTWTAPRDTWIGTVPIGYADGYNRRFSNNARMLVNGRSCEVAGRVCMDQVMLDLGPDATDAVGDVVTVLGRDGEEEVTTAELAERMGTIPYEVTCLITSRPQRAFLG